MKKTIRTVLIILLCAAAAFAGGWFAARGAGPAEPQPEKETALHAADPAYEYLAGATVYQLSAESDALILQAFETVKSNISDLLLKCADEAQPDWQLITDPSGENEMYHDGKRVAIICDVDDTLVNGVNYTADILGNNGDWNNAAFSRFLMSDTCTALPGAVECMNFCKENGVEVYYLTNRYDQGYKVGQSDSRGSYDQYVKEHGEEGTYVSTDGNIIGTSVYQLFGKSMYDITLESMLKLGFPIDDSHLIVNDNKLMGGSKEKARQAIIGGCEDYANGQRADENSLGTGLTFSCGAHEVVMLLGDQMTDFTDAFDDGSMDAAERRAFTAVMAEKFGTEWILFPNAVYGKAMDTGLAYGTEKLFQEYAYTK
ncbi:MAG: HAD family acid phosphatase [Clostridia bacterium]|nr:HAD family acid phosphatase [Clostridia bacterium]